MVGNGVGRWNTMPMRPRSWTASMLGSYTSCPSSSTLPVIQPPSDSSCMRFRQRRNVVLPHPDGPINAVTVCLGNRIDTSLTTARRPYSAVSRAVWSCSRASAGGAMTLPDRPAGGEGKQQDQSHQHERRGPGEAGPLFEGAGAVGVGLGRLGRRRLQGGGRKLKDALPLEGQRGGFPAATGQRPED